MLTSLRSVLALGVVAAALVTAAMPSYAQSPGSEGEDVIVAKVNGEPIYRTEVIEMFRQQVPQQMQQMGIQPFYDMLVDRLVGYRLLVEEGRAKGMADDEEVQDQMAQLENTVIRIVYIQRLIEEGVTEERIAAAYQEYVDQNPPKEEAKARHILVETEAEAKEIIGLLQAGGSFEGLARERSTGPSGPQGGDLGYFGRGQMVGEFEDAVFALAVGQFTDEPVQTQFGWHVILVEDKRMTEPEPMEDVRQRLVEQLSGQVAQEIIEDRVTSAEVERFDIQGNPVAEAPTEEAPAANQ